MIEYYSNGAKLPSQKPLADGLASASSLTTKKEKIMVNTPIPPINRKDPNGVAIWIQAQIDDMETRTTQKNNTQFKLTPLVNETLYKIIVIATISAIVVMSALIYFLIPSIISIAGLPLNPQWFFYLGMVAYILLSFRMVGIDEIAGADFFGTPVFQFSRGLKWVPLGILNFDPESIQFVQGEFPGDADKIQWSDEKKELLEGMVRPIFVLTGENPDGSLPTDRQMSIGISFLVKIKLIKERFFDFIQNIAPIDEAKAESLLAEVTGGTSVTLRMLEVLRHLRDTGGAYVLEIVGKISYSELTNNINLVNQLLKLCLEYEVSSWGIEMVEVRFTKTNPGHDFNEKLQSRGAALASRDVLITVAEGEKRKRQLEGEGTASAALALLTAQAEGYTKIMTATGVDGAGVLSAEVARELANGQNNTVVVDGASGLIGMALAGAKVISTQSKGA